MLATILIWLYTIFTIYMVGWMTSQLLFHILKIQPLSQLSFPLICLVGMAVMSFIASTFSLFLPLGMIAQITVLSITIFAFILRIKYSPLSFRQLVKQCFSTRIPVTLLILIAGLATLILAIQIPNNYDTGLYHAQAIRWIETYPAIPGLANLHSRLGYNSSWLVLQALYSFAFIGGNSYHLMTSVLFLIAILFFGQGINRFWNGKRNASDWFNLLSFPLLLYMFSDQVSSPGNDTPVALISWIIISGWIHYFEKDTTNNDLHPVILTLLSVYAITVKLSAFPLLIGSTWIFFQFLTQRKYLSLVVMMCTGIVLLIPWMARSIIQTGYLVYPFPSIDLLSFDWKIPKDVVVIEAETIKNWARLPNQTDRSESLSFRGWAREWFFNQTLNRRLILASLGVLPGLLGFCSLNRKFRQCAIRYISTVWPAYLIIFSGILFWFFTAPDFRFGTAFIMPGIILLVIPFIQFITEHIPFLSRYIPPVVIGLIFTYQLSTFVSMVDIQIIKQYAQFPANYPTTSYYPDKIGNLRIWLPDENAYSQCWYQPFPCIPKPNQAVELRGTRYIDGFRQK